MGREIVAKWLRDMLPKKCMNCGETRQLTYHHIVPVILGGNDVPSNISVLCSKCHAKVHFGKDGHIGHGELIKAGIEQARKKGHKSGKRPADHENVMRLIAENSTQFNRYSEITEHEIMQMAGVKDVCYYKCKRMLLDAMKSDVWPYSWSKPKQNFGHPLYENIIKTRRGYV